MGVIKKKYNDHLIKNPHKEPKEPQHIIDERKVDEAIERMYDQRQWDMYNDDTWNWSGLR